MLKTTAFSILNNFVKFPLVYRCKEPGFAKQFWPNSGRILAEFWPNFGRVLAEFWPNFGRILAEFWPNSGRILAEFWPKFKLVFESNYFEFSVAEFSAK